jgi:flagellar protein FliO/FliZ
VDTLFLALRVVVSLSAVLGVIWFAQRRLIRGKLLQKAVREIRVVARQSLGSKASVVLIEADGKRLMLGVTDHSVTVLDSSVLAASAAAEPEPAPASAVAPGIAPSAAAAAERQPAAGSRQPAAGSREPQQGDFAALLADAEVVHWTDAPPAAWKRPRANLRRGSHR